MGCDVKSVAVDRAVIKPALRWAVLLCGLWLTACAALLPPLQEPQISLTAFRLLPSNSLNPEFMIDLHVVNPNDRQLSLRGLAYSASIEGHRVISGASNELPVIAAYGEADISLRARADMMAGLKLVNDLLGSPRDQLKFELSLQLDAGALFPTLHIRETGTLSLGAGERRSAPAK